MRKTGPFISDFPVRLDLLKHCDYALNQQPENRRLNKYKS